MFSYIKLYTTQLQCLIDTMIKYYLLIDMHFESFAFSAKNFTKITTRYQYFEDIKMGSLLFQCDVTQQWIAQRQVGPVSVYCDGMGCHVLCLRHGIPVSQHIG